MIGNGQYNQSNIQKKKDEFRKKRRTQYLQAYMKKVRMDLIQSNEHNQYIQLRSMIDELFSQRLNEQDKQKQDEERKKKIVLQLISFANKGNNTAIVAISQLLLNRIITVENIEDYYFEQQQKNGQMKRKQIMEIFIFPTKDNDGWLALIRVLLNLGYCTQQMVTYCINTTVRSRSMNALDLSLEVLYILVIEKKLVPIQDIYKLTIKQKSSKNNQRPLRTQELIYALMKHSLDSVYIKECSDIRYNSTKLLMKSFQTQTVLQDLILRLIPLERIAIYIKDKFQITKFYDKSKALKMMSCLLICLSNYNHYEPQQIISVVSGPLIPILNYVKKLSYDIDLAHSLNQRKNLQLKRNNSGDIDQNFGFLQEAIFMIQILIDNYLFCTQSFDLIITSLEAFILEHILIYLHSAYYRQVKLNLIQQEQSSQSSNQGLTQEDMLKCLLVQKITKLTQKIISNLISLSYEIRKGNLVTSPENIQKFVLVRNLIISRFRKSQLQNIVQHQLQLSGIDLHYI